MKKITYGTYIYVEYDVTLSIKGKEVNVHFSGGSISAQGVTPATYTTSNPVVQCAIEKLTSYKQGKIVKVREVSLSASMPQLKNVPATEPQGTDSRATEPQGTDGRADDETDDGLAVTKVEASCREDVVEYLKEHFGYAGTQLRGDMLKKAVAEHKLVVVGFEL